VRDAEFYQLLEDLAAAGAAAHWHGRVRVLEAGQVSDTPGEDPARYIGVPGMSAWTERLARPLQVTCGVRVAAVVRERDHWRLLAADRLLGVFDLVVLAVPAPQALPLLTAAPALAAQVRAVRMRPTWTLMTAFGQPLDLPFDGAFVPRLGGALLGSPRQQQGGAAGSGMLGAPRPPRLVRDASRGRAGGGRPGAAGGLLGGGRTRPARAHLVLPHRWRYAVPERTLSEPFLTALSGRLGLCGDWCGGPRIEGAFLSGRALARHLLDRFSP
jgi:renalase